jgi:peptide/nickel transport system permease protein
MTQTLQPQILPAPADPQTRLRRTRIRWVPALPIAILSVIIVLAVLAPWVTPYDPTHNELANRLLPPFFVSGGNTDHLLGTDAFGRDVLTRLLYGARASLAVTALSMTILVVLGTAVGVVAGYAGGWVDSTLMRLVDILLAIPTLLIGMVVAVVLGPSFWNVVFVIGLLAWPRVARLIRGETLGLRETDFVHYSRAIGVTQWSVAIRHVLPNVLPTLLVAATLESAHIILQEAALSFLGAGIPPPEASWGVMISDGRALISTGWWIAFFPGLAIGITVLSANALGDWMRDHFDPRTREV